jgi:hypothetical protein
MTETLARHLSFTCGSAPTRTLRVAMDLTPPLAPSDTNSIRVVLPEPVDGYLARLADQQTRFLASWTDANRSLHPSSGQVAKLASIQLRLAQEFLDAQRAIVRRRAETDAAIHAIAADAASEAAALVDDARSRASIVLGTLPPPVAGASELVMPGCAPPPNGAPASRVLASFGPPSPTSPAVQLAAPGIDDESLARLIDGVFEPGEPDGVAARRDLRSLLDGWWSVENQEAQAAIDDAQARAAMHLHLAQVEAAELARFAPPVPSAPEPSIYVSRSSNALPAPFASALDGTDHQHLDDVLAHLLDSLEPASTIADGDGTQGPSTADTAREFVFHLPDPGRPRRTR